MEPGKKLEILVVESDERYIESMKKFIHHQETHVDYWRGYDPFKVEFTYARTYDELESMLEEREYDAVISDIYLPRSEGEEKELIGKEILDLVGKYDSKLVYCTMMAFGREEKDLLKEVKKEGALHVESFDTGSRYGKDWSMAFTFAVTYYLYEDERLGRFRSKTDSSYIKKRIGTLHGYHDEIDIGYAFDQIWRYKKGITAEE